MSEELLKRTITFPSPVQIGDVSVASVTVREPLVDDELEAQARATAEAAKKGRPPLSGEIEAHLLAILSGLPADGLRRMRSLSYRRIQAVLLGFFSSTPSGSPGGSLSSDGSPGTVPGSDG